MGKSVRNSDPFVLGDQDVKQAAPKARANPQKQEEDPFVLGDDEKGLVKKKADGTGSATAGGPGPSGSLSEDAINQSSKAYQDKTLSVGDQDVLAKTDWGKQAGLDMPDAWRKTFVKAHNGPKTSELLNSVVNVLNANYPQMPPGTPQNQVREQIFTNVQKGDIPAIQKTRNSIVDSKQQQILKIQNEPQGIEHASGVIGAPAYTTTSSTIRELSDEQKQEVQRLQDEIGVAKASLDAFTVHAIVNKKDHLMQLKAELSPQNSKFTDLTLSAESVGQEMDRTVGINKTIPNTRYEHTRAGLEAIMSSYQMDINDLTATGMKSKNPDLLKQAEAKGRDLDVLQARYNNLDNQYPDVGTYKTARFLGDILSKTNPNRLITTSEDVRRAAAIADRENPGFMASHGKFVDVVAKSEGDWIGVKTGMIPQGGFVGGLKTGLEDIASSGAAFVASPLGFTWDEKTLKQAQAEMEAPQVKGTSRTGILATKVTYDKENKVYREEKNENYGQWNYNSAMYSLGKGIPTLAEWIVLDKGIGGLAKGVGGVALRGANAIGRELTATTDVLLGAKDVGAGYQAAKLGSNFEKAAGLYGTTYVTSFDENRKLADNLIDDKTSMGEAKKNVLANFLTISTAGIFSMMDYSPTKAIEAALTKSAAPDVLKMLEKTQWKDLTEAQATTLLKEQILPRVRAVVRAAGESAVAGAKLGAAGVLDQKIKDFASLLVNPEKAQPSSVEENLHSFVDQVLLMTVVGIPGMVKSGAFPSTSKDALYHAGLLGPQYIDRINDRATQGDLDQATANKMVSMVRTMAEEVAKARDTNNKDGTPLTVQQKRDVAVSNFRKRAADMLTEANVPVGPEKVHSEADGHIDAVLSENKWNNIEEGVPFQSARDLDTGKKLASVDDIDPKKSYTYEKEGKTVTTNGAELFDHLINGDYEQVDKNKNAETAEGEKTRTPQAGQAGETPESEAGKDEKAVKADVLAQGKAAIEKGITDKKLTGVYVHMARANPEIFLKDIADQVHGNYATGEKVSGEGVGGEDAELSARENYGDDIVDAAKTMYPKEKKIGPPTAVIRHGESRANADKTLSVDETPLTQRGEQQATKLGKDLQAKGYTDVLPSATTRAEQTAALAVEQTGGKVLEDPSLTKLLKEWDQAGGETIDEFAKRIAKAREGIDELPKGTAVIAHGKVMGMLEALDKTDGDIEKAKEAFDKTKVYGNTDTYIPSTKTATNEEKSSKLNEKGAGGKSKTGPENSPQGGKEGDGKSSAVGDERPVNRNVSQTAQGSDGEGRQKEGDDVNEKGAVPDESTAPTRQAAVNDLVEKTTAFNNLRRNDPGKAFALNEIRLQARELGLKVDYAKGFASITDEQGNKVQRRSEETNQTPAKDFDLTKYADKTKDVVTHLVAADLPLTGLSIMGFDGRQMSEAQKETAFRDIKEGNITNGAKAVYDAFEGMVKDGFVELIDPSSRQRVGVPLEEYLQAVKAEVKPLTDSELSELNSTLGEDVFGKIFDDIFAEENEPTENEQPAKETEPAQPAPAGETGESAPPPGGDADGASTGEQPAAQPEVQAEIPEEKVTGIRNVVVNSERMDRSLDAVVKEAATNFKEVWQVAKSLVKGGNVDPRSLVSSLADDPKPKVSDVDNALILMDRIDLTNQRYEILAALEKAQAAGDPMSELGLSQRLMDVDQKIAQNDEVSDRTGQETARALSSRRMLATLDFTLSKMTADIRRLYPDGSVPDSMTERLKKIEKDHADLLRKYSDREEEWKRTQAEKAFQEEKTRTENKMESEKGAKKITRKGKDLADKIRSLRPKGGDAVQSNLFGLPIAVYDTALVTLANLVEGGAKLADAIKETIKGINFPEPKDRDEFIDFINGTEEITPEETRLNLVNKIVADAKEQNSTSLVKDSITPLRKIASSYIKEGIGSLDELVNKIHGELSKLLPDVSERDIRDAFSGYGNERLETRNDLARQVKELQKQAVLVSQMEDVLQGERPERKGKKSTTTSKEVVRLRGELEKSMKDNGMTWEEPPRDPAQQAQRALQSAKNRLKTQIEQLNHQLETGEAPAGKTTREWDAERTALKEERDALKGILAQTTGGSKLSDAMRIKRVENSLKRQIGQYEEKINQGGGPLRVKTEPVTTPQIERLKVRRNALKELNRKLQVDASPKSTPQQIALQAYKDRLKARIDTLTRRASEGDFEPKERQTITKDAEAMKLDLALKKTESEFYSLKGKAEKENRGRTQKIFDKIAAYKRFAVLSGLPSLGKIALAVTYRTIGTPVEELVGAGIRHVPGISQVARQAPREGGGFNVGAEHAALSEWVKAKTYQDWWNVLKTGKGELDLAAGKYAENDPELIEVFGRIHASLKNFSKRAEFARGFEQRINYARKKGFDTSDSVVRMTAAMDAYGDAKRSIFMQDNVLTKEYFKFLKRMEGDETQFHSKLAAFLLRFTMPVVKVPTNFIAETTTYTAGALTGTAQIIYKAIQGNLTKLSPQEADQIMRSLKKGSVGLTLGVIGYLMPQLAGGFWQRGDNRDEDEVQPGELMFFGQRIPKWATHFPALEAMQFGATLRRSFDKRSDDKGEETGKAATGSLFDAAGGLLGEVPLFEQPTQLMDRIKYGEWDKLVGDEFKSLDPQLMQNIANWTDSEDGKTVKRDPQNPWENLKTGIPGLRQTVQPK